MPVQPDRADDSRREAASAPLQQVTSRPAGIDVSTLVPAARASDYVRGIARRWHIVALALACVICGAGIYLSTAEKQYDATAHIVTSRSQLVSTLFGSSGGQSADPERDVNTNLEVITSEAVARRVRQQLGLRTPIAPLLAQITTSTKGNSNVISVMARDSQPARAAAIATSFAMQYVSYQDEVTRAQFGDAAHSVQQQLARMTRAERGSPEGQALVQRLQQLQIAGSVNTSGVRLLDPATLPTSAATPRTTFVVALALIVGLLLGCACAVGLAVLRDPAFRR
jgi:uncharacterized protein involved in exopolysaccharide biosynthesis